MKELTTEQREVADSMVHRIMPVVIGYNNAVGMRTTANTLLGIAIGNALEAGMDPVELMACVANALRDSAKCPLCGRRELHEHRIEEINTHVSIKTS